MRRRIRGIECQICGEKHVTNKLFLFSCPDCRAHLPDGIKLYLAILTVLLSLLMAGFLFVFFPPDVLENSTILNSSFLKGAADRITKVGEFVGISREGSEGDRVPFVSLNEEKAIDEPLFLFIIFISLGVGSRVYRLTRHRILKWFGWIYEKQTDSWIAIPKEKRSVVGDFVFLTIVRDKWNTFRHRKYLLSVVIAEVMPYLIVMMTSTNINDVSYVPIIGLFLICLAGIISGYFGYQDFSHMIIGGILAITGLNFFFLIVALQITDVMPIFGPNFGERLEIFIHWIRVPFLLFLLHYPAFILYALLGKGLRFGPRKYLTAMFTSVLSREASVFRQRGKNKEPKERGLHPPGKELRDLQPAQTKAKPLDNYERAQQNLDDARRELEYTIASGASEYRVEEARRLYLLAQEELDEVLESSAYLRMRRKLVELVPSQVSLSSQLSTTWASLPRAVRLIAWTVFLLSGLWFWVSAYRFLVRTRSSRLPLTLPPLLIWGLKRVLPALLILLPGLLYYWALSFPRIDQESSISNPVPAIITPIILPGQTLEPLQTDVSFKYRVKFLSNGTNREEVTVRFVVMDSQKNPVPNAEVYIRERGTSTTIKSEKTDSSGVTSITIPINQAKPFVFTFYQLTLNPIDPGESNEKSIITAPDSFIWITAESGDTVEFLFREQ